MKSFTKILLGAAGAVALLTSGAEAGAIAANPNPISFDAGFGKVTVDGQLTGLAYYQSNSNGSFYGTWPGNAETYLDIDNALVSVAKTDGMFQFYVEGGLYSFPTVGNPYVKATATTPATFGAVPMAYGKIQLDDSFSIEAGKLPTLVGAELAFTPQNINIERGLLWWQEPLVSRGVQANYASGPLSVSLSWNDGSYTNIWNTGSGLISFAIDSSDTLAFDASVTAARNGYAGNQIYDLMYSYSADPWTIGPYVQYQHFDDTKYNGYSYNDSSSEWGIGVLASYQLDPNWSLNGRAEYEASSGNGWALEYGNKSKAWSLTVTPTYQDGLFFARGELSYTGLSDQTVGFGKNFDKDNQFRALFETGIVL
jgi:hypothetical protein